MRKVTAVEDVVHDDLAAFSEQCFGDMAAHEAHATSHQDTLAVNVSRLRGCVVLCWERRGLGLHLRRAHAEERLEEDLGRQRTADLAPGGRSPGWWWRLLFHLVTRTHTQGHRGWGEGRVRA